MSLFPLWNITFSNLTPISWFATDLEELWPKMGLTTSLYYLFIVQRFDIYYSILRHFISRLTLVSIIIDN